MGRAFGVLRVEISVLGAGPEATADSVLALRDELLELDLDSVGQAVRGPVPPGAKGMPGGAGPLIVTLSDSAVLVALAGMLKSWVSRDRNRKVTIRIGNDLLEVTRASGQEQARLIEAWLGRHARR
jgi:Effector Associated Constant Component 1